MIVYRYLTDKELKNFLKGNTWDLGARPTAEQLDNCKRYQAGVRYIHFFKNLRDLPKIQSIDSDPKGKYIGMFNMPMRFAVGGNGIGEYFGKIEGASQIKEFAVEVRALRLAEFVDYIYDEHCNLTEDEAKEMFAELGQEPDERE